MKHVVEQNNVRNTP